MIRTLDPLLPKQVRYQAALYSDRGSSLGKGPAGPVLVRRGGVIAAVGGGFKRFWWGFLRCCDGLDYQILQVSVRTASGCLNHCVHSGIVQKSEELSWLCIT